MRSEPAMRSVFIWLFLYAAAMAFVESAVVVYLRWLYYPDGFSLTVQSFPVKTVLIEAVREAATLVMLFSVAALAGKSRAERAGAFIFMFGVWDIFYYVWLKVMLDWPAALTDPDILFLIPVAWVGPVLAPVLVSCGMIAVGILLFYYERHACCIRTDMIVWLLVLGGCAIIFASFVFNTGMSGEDISGTRFRWELFLAGTGMAAGGAWRMFHSPRLKNKEQRLKIKSGGT
ncbi:hypothetical protein JW948_09360 [bacterium]|nr:hypothetical protein [bacterium]